MRIATGAATAMMAAAATSTQSTSVPTGVPCMRPREAWVRCVTGLCCTMVWSQGGCASWYVDAHGRNRLTWPGSHTDFDRRNRAAGLEGYRRA